MDDAPLKKPHGGKRARAAAGWAAWEAPQLPTAAGDWTCGGSSSDCSGSLAWGAAPAEAERSVRRCTSPPAADRLAAGGISKAQRATLVRLRRQLRRQLRQRQQTPSDSGSDRSCLSGSSLSSLATAATTDGRPAATKSSGDVETSSAALGRHMASSASFTGRRPAPHGADAGSIAHMDERDLGALLEHASSAQLQQVMEQALDEQLAAPPAQPQGAAAPACFDYQQQLWWQCAPDPASAAQMPQRPAHMPMSACAAPAPAPGAPSCGELPGAAAGATGFATQCTWGCGDLQLPDAALLAEFDGEATCCCDDLVALLMADLDGAVASD